MRNVARVSAEDASQVLVDALIYDAVEEVGIDVDQLRRASGASPDRLYFTGIEFAVGAAMAMVVRFVRGAIRGAERRAQERGLTVETLGEAAGAAVVDGLADRLDALIRDPEHAPDAGAGRDALKAEIARTLTAARPVLDAVRDAEDLVDPAQELETFLRGHGMSEQRAAVLAERVARRLRDELLDDDG